MRLDGTAVYLTPREELAHGGFKRVFGSGKFKLTDGSWKMRVIFSFQKDVTIEEFQEENARLALRA